MSWWVYILECRDGTLYTGCTDDIPRRLAMHNAGKGAKYTPDRAAALWREAAVKRLNRAEKIRLIAAFEQENGCGG